MASKYSLCVFVCVEPVIFDIFYLTKGLFTYLGPILRGVSWTFIIIWCNFPWIHEQVSSYFKHKKTGAIQICTNKNLYKFDNNKTCNSKHWKQMEVTKIKCFQI